MGTDEKKGSGEDAGVSRVALAAVFTGASCIAFAPIFVRLSEVGPSATAFWRVGIALPALFAWMTLENRATQKRRPSSQQDFGLLMIPGLFFAADLAVWHWSIRFTTVANATLLANFAPIFVTLGSWLIFRRKVTGLFLTGMAVALAGTIVLMGTSFQISMTYLFGDSLGLITAIFYAGYILSVKELRDTFSAPTIMTFGGVSCSLVLLLVSLISGESLGAASLNGWLVLIGLALISHVGGQGLIAFALGHLPAAFSSVSLLLQPVIAAVLAMIILSESLGLFQAIGGIVVLAGIALSRRGSSLK